jgi:hypothetical protein
MGLPAGIAAIGTEGARCRIDPPGQAVPAADCADRGRSQEAVSALGTLEPWRP